MNVKSKGSTEEILGYQERITIRIDNKLMKLRWDGNCSG